MWLIVGLGNPGDEYERTRHNIGALVVQSWASRSNDKLAKTKKSQSLTCSVRIGTESAVLSFPQTYMNESGSAVKSLMNFYKVDAEHLIVLHDELDLPFAHTRLKLGGGDNGHNGLRSIRSAIGHGDWYRLRLGIGRPPGVMDPASYVLRSFSKSEQTEVELLCGRAIDAVECLVLEGLAEAQGRFNQ